MTGVPDSCGVVDAILHSGVGMFRCGNVDAILHSGVGVFRCGVIDAILHSGVGVFRCGVIDAILHSRVGVADNQTDTTSPCTVIDDYLQHYYGLSIFALLVVILLSWFEKRKSFARNVCFGRPGCLTPVNLLDGDEDPFAYAAAFGSTASTVFSLFTNQSDMYQKVNYNPWLIPLVVMELTIELGLQVYPLFTCIQYRWSLAMSSVGFMYSAILLSLNIVNLKFCSELEYDIPLQLPVLLCLGFLCIKFAFNFITTTVRFVKIRQGRQWLVLFKFLGDDIRLILKEVIQGSIDNNSTDTATVERLADVIEGYIMNCIVLTVVGILLSYGLILPVMKKAPDYFLNPVRALLPSIVITQGTIFILYFISLWFLQKTDISQSKLSFKRVLAITNRRAFQNLSYFLFFFYIPLGLVKSVSRNLFSFLCGLAFLGRLDRCIFVPGLENLDYGYLSYISFLKVEISHCSPVVVAFCNILYTEMRSKFIKGNSASDRSELLPTSETMDDDSDIISFCESEARKRWFKCYTLVKNPDICSTSKRYIQKNDKKIGGLLKSRDCNNSLYGTIA
ncbi:hypothetical protein FSP39_007963 [Pinctada imbricata]|uniref:Uncharacterized protein n=1 Tax=Pinctada imbricata TaxID=66713 RepID=A0AA88XQS4_PINIB|nr:hypothetical protein FSP39_007963 [Pinctada imbricata]